MKEAIFGLGDGASIQAAFLGDSPARTYPRMIEVLNALGLKYVKESDGGHNNHYHIDFKTPNPISIVKPPKKIEGAKSELVQNLIQEVDGMRLVDLMIAGVLSGVASDQLIAAPTEQSQFKTNHAAGYCILFSPYQDDVVEGATMRTIGVERVAWNYAAKILRVGVGVEMPLSSDIYVEVYPSHGRLNLERATVHSAEAWAYHPDPGFVGADKAVFLVRIKGHLIRVVASLRVEASMEKILANRCSPYGWVISSADVGESAAIARTALTLNRSDLGSLISSAIYSVSTTHATPNARCCTKR